MRKLILMATVAAIGAAGVAFAGTHVEIKDPEIARQEAHTKWLNDHPLTKVVENKDLKVKIEKDAIMRSCCMPPNLVVYGKITNISSEPIDYVRLLFSFEDDHGKVLKAESLYNNNAISLNDDENMQKILNEKPHFKPLKPGETDSFSYSIPFPMLPRQFTKVELFTTNVKQEQQSAAALHP